MTQQVGRFVCNVMVSVRHCVSYRAVWCWVISRAELDVALGQTSISVPPGFGIFCTVDVSRAVEGGEGGGVTGSCAGWWGARFKEAGGKGQEGCAL